MKRWVIPWVVVGLCLPLIGTAAPPNPAGRWKGGFEGDYSKLPVAKTPAEKKALAAMVEAMKSARFDLLLKADHTFKMDITGVANGKAMKNRSEGKWELLGATVQTTTLKRDGKVLPAGQQKKNRLALAPNGKMLTLKVDSAALNGRVVLRRG